MSYRNVIMKDSPSAYWPLNEPSGTTAFDRSGNARNTTWNTNPSAYSVEMMQDLYGVTLNDTQETSVAYASWQHPSSGSLECWIRSTETAITALFTTRVTSSGYGLYLNHSVAGDATMQHDATPSGIVAESGDVDVNDGNLHHIVGTWEGSATLKIYVDGTLRDTTTESKTLLDGGVDAFRFAGENATRRLTGDIGHAAIYPTALTANQVKTHYKAGIRNAVVVG